ncbi:MAG: hypothetical protein AUJ52_00280 [Elusimicrobia bacterium CG1_02_63_36]|nr:MAG: hypothetical protein AUJ52_00280 [Elusimicrobia bacterium CG1_02_63_36]PIP81609.1 MAG: hypothetical protein COR54_19290 [Elusimicrobia bacterium CG22_combo_CG10-13_8_21_14_all_63_91]PJA16011.1 MAG: hypothetical protein COX66_08605 [Elusimicrobia bacterium CG_4_10_14_0_2_um_filter_63_34]PJB26416.1 MAG: hypothetical protein CO113_03575 [Elusimicrobia bacterium CG_4_9_14_3_um_filter_62_55]
MDCAGELAGRLESRDYRAVKALLNEGALEPLAECWPRLPLFDRLTAFKLLSPERAWAFFENLGEADRYALFTGFDLGSIAPVLEPLPDSERALFVALPESFRDRMAETLR